MASKDLAHLSDDELEKIASGGGSSKKDVSQLSDEELEAIAGSNIKADMEDASKMSRMDAAKIGLERGATLGFRPAVAGAGAGLGSLIGNLQQDVKGEGLADRLKRAFSSVPGAYEEGRKGAIAEENQARTDRPGYAMAGDIAGNILTAPLVPLKGVKAAAALGAAQGAGRAISEGEDLTDAAGKFGEGVGYGLAGYGAGKAIGAAGNAAAPYVKAGLNKVGSVVSEKTGNAATKIASTLTGVSEGDIKTYAKNAKEIVAMSKSSAGNVAEAADQVRQKFSDSINQTRSKLNSKISTALKSSNQSVDAAPILDALATQKGKINPKLYTKEIGQIDDLIEKVGSLAENGKLKVSDAHDVKMFLQDRASSAYGFSSDPASLGAEAARAAKSGAAVARKLVNEAEPAVASANNQLAKLHDITDDLNRNILNVGKPESALLAAGSGGNARNATGLVELGKATGTDMLGEAQKLSAMRTFGNPQLLPVDSTGKAVARMATGAGVGTLVGGPVGTLMGSALTSPMALKAAIDTGRISGEVISKVLGKPLEMTERGLTEALRSLNTPQGLAVLSQVAGQQRPGENALSRRMERIATEQNQGK